MKVFLLFTIIFPLITFAQDIEVSNLKIRCKDKHNSYYFDLYNNNDFTDYLVKLELVKPFQQDLKIQKTVIDKDIVKIINLSQVALPAKTIVKFSPYGIFILGEAWQNYRKEHQLTLKLIYKIQGSKFYTLSSENNCN